MATIQKTATLADILDETTNTQNYTDLPDFATYTGRWYEEQLDKFRTNRHAQLESDKSLTKPQDDSVLSEEDQLLVKTFNIVETSLTSSMKSQLVQLLNDHTKAFAEGPYDLGCFNGSVHSIDTGDHAPIACNPHRLAKNDQTYLRHELDEFLKHGVIEETSSDWAAPIVMVPKKDGTKRLCVDFRKLNAVAKCSAYPIPKIQDIFNLLQGSRYFTSIDLTKGFLQIALDKDSQPKTAFTTCFGQFQFVRMPFGLNSSPAAFQAAMNKTLNGLLWNNCVVYIDDILIFTTNFEDHLRVLKLVLQRLIKFNLKANASKCDFGRTQLNYLGHVLNSQGLHVSPKMIATIADWKFPTCVLEVEQFLGKANYYSKFIYNFSKLAKPLYELTTHKATRFIPLKEHYDAFETLKTMLCQAPVLKHPDFTKTFILYTDASGHGIGAVLSQGYPDGIHPVSYASRALRDAELRYSAIEREALGIFWAVSHFEEYVDGKHFILFTDHKPLVTLMTSYQVNRRLNIISLKLAHLSFTIVWRKGSENTNADVLSRYPYVPTKGRKSRASQTNESLTNQFDATSDLSTNCKVITKRNTKQSLTKTKPTKTIATLSSDVYPNIRPKRCISDSNCTLPVIREFTNRDLIDLISLIDWNTRCNKLKLLTIIDSSNRNV